MSAWGIAQRLFHVSNESSKDLWTSNGKTKNAIGGEHDVVQAPETFYAKPGERRPSKCPTKTEYEHPCAV